MPLDFSAIPWDAVGIQLIGFAAMALAFASYQAKKRTTILTVQILSSTLWALQFFLLGAAAGLANNLIAIVRNAIFAQQEKHAWARARLLPAIFILLYVAAAVYAYTLEGWLCLLPLFGMVLQTFAYNCENERSIRLLSLGVSPPWLVYDAIKSSAAGVLCESLNILSILLALFRYRNNKKEANK